MSCTIPPKTNNIKSSRTKGTFAKGRLQISKKRIMKKIGITCRFFEERKPFDCICVFYENTAVKETYKT